MGKIESWPDPERLPLAEVKLRADDPRSFLSSTTSRVAQLPLTMQKPEGWDKTAQDYDSLSVVVTAPFIRDSIGHLPAHADHILDVATGTGLFPIIYTSFFPHRAKEFLASDFSPKMIEIFKTRIPAGSVITTAVQDAQDLSTLSANHYNIIGCYFGAMFFPERKKAFDGFHRVLAPNGVLAMTTWSKMDVMVFFARVRGRIPIPAAQPPPQSLPLNSIAAVEAELKASGFTKVHCSLSRRTIPISRELLVRTGLTLPLLQNVDISREMMEKAINDEIDASFPGGAQPTLEMEAVVTIAHK